MDRVAKEPRAVSVLRQDINATVAALLEFGEFEPKTKHAQAARIATTLIYKRVIELGWTPPDEEEGTRV